MHQQRTDPNANEAARRKHDRGEEVDVLRPKKNGKTYAIGTIAASDVACARC